MAIPSAAVYVGPLSTTFTPPISCFHTTGIAFETSVFSDFWVGGLLHWADATYTPATSCFPPGFAGLSGSYPTPVFYSPGVCPASYTTAYQTTYGEEILAYCCQSGLTLDSFQYLSCYSAASTQVVLDGIIDFGSATPTLTSTAFTVASVSAIIEGSAIAVRNRRNAISIPDDGSSIPDDKSSTPDVTVGQTITAISDSFSPSTLSFTASATRPQMNQAPRSLSVGAMAGIGVGVSVVGISILTAVGVFIWKRRKRVAATRARRNQLQGG